MGSLGRFATWRQRRFAAVGWTGVNGLELASVGGLVDDDHWLVDCAELLQVGYFCLNNAVGDMNLKRNTFFSGMIVIAFWPTL